MAAEQGAQVAPVGSAAIMKAFPSVQIANRKERGTMAITLVGSAVCDISIMRNLRLLIEPLYSGG
jgi:hypothetical protein